MKKLIVLFILVMAVSIADAGDCTKAKFSWTPNNDVITTGYAILYGAEKGVYPERVDVGMPEVISDRMKGEVSGLVCGDTYHFVVIAYAENGIRSPYSNRLSVNYVPDMPGTPTNLRVNQLTINIIVE